MIRRQDVTTKNNVRQFDTDVRQTGSYAYTAERLSARLANIRISDCIARSYDFSGRRVLDLGCGDGTYSLEFPALGATEVVGVDPAIAAIDAASSKAQMMGLDSMVKFKVGNIYALESYLADNFDCVVLRGVLHHLSDPARAISGLAAFEGTIVVLEPNGMNPVVKLLEKYSRYHIDHEERSFTAALVRNWLTAAGFRVQFCKVFNLVPFFCPNWMVKVLRIVEPVIERLPLVRDIACGQNIIVAYKNGQSP